MYVDICIIYVLYIYNIYMIYDYRILYMYLATSKENHNQQPFKRQTIPSDRPGAVHTCHSDAPNVAWIRTQQRLGYAGFNEWKLCQMKQVFSKRIEQMLKSFRIENWGELEVHGGTFSEKSTSSECVLFSPCTYELGCCRCLNLRDITWSMHFHVQLEETAYDLHCKSVWLPSGYLT